MTEQKYLPVPDAIFAITGLRPSAPTCQRLVSRRLITTWKMFGKRVTTLTAAQEYVNSCKSKKDKSNTTASELLAALDSELAGA